MKKRMITKLLGAGFVAPFAAAGLWFASASPGNAELREVDQTIFGMDCAPCAIGVERRIGGFEGVEEVKLSLNEGTAVAQFAPENRVTLEEIRDAIRRNAFNAREARIEVAGEIAIDDEDRRVLVTEAGERFILQRGEEAPEAWERLEDMAPGERVAVKGSVPAGREGPWELTVVEFKDERSVQ